VSPNGSGQAPAECVSRIFWNFEIGTNSNVRTLAMDLSVLKTPRLPITRTASPVGHRDNLNGRSGDPVNYPVRETSEEKFPRIMQMHRPTLRTGLDLTDGVIEFRDESICGSGIAFGIPLVGSLCLSDRLRMEPNAWSGQWIVRGSGAAPRTRERSLLFPDLDHRCGVQSPYSMPIRHPHRQTHPSCRADDRQAQHVLQQADGGLLLRLFCASVSSEEFYISPSHEHKFPLAEVAWLED
jgi:hypothetical protein